MKCGDKSGQEVLFEHMFEERRLAFRASAIVGVDIWYNLLARSCDTSAKFPSTFIPLTSDLQLITPVCWSTKDNLIASFSPSNSSLVALPKLDFAGAAD